VAGMPKYEKTRNERERASQKRLLASVPKRNIVLAVINSAFFLWLLSAILLTIGGGYVTNHQQCMREADQFIARRSHLASEIFSRNAAFATTIADAKKLQPPFQPSKQGSLYPDLSNLPYGEVERELLMLYERIELDELPDPEILKAQLRRLDYNSMRADREYTK
jgi:hypothetical protein